LISFVAAWGRRWYSDFKDALPFNFVQGDLILRLSFTYMNAVIIKGV
jgi:hypothetical protein